RTPTFQIDIQTDPKHLVGGKKTVLYTLFERVGINRITKVFGAGNRFGFLRCGGKANVGGSFKIFQNLTPGTVFRGATTVALIDNDQIEEIRTEFAISVLVFIVVGQPLIQRQIYLIGFVDLLLLYDRHFVFEMTEITAPGLVDQGITVGQKQYALLGSGLPEAVDDLKGGIGFSSAGGHR